MTNLRSAVVVALGTLCATAAFAQSRPSVGVAPIVVLPQEPVIRQQMYNRGQENAQGIAQEQAQSQQLLSNMAQRNEQMLNAQEPAPPPSPATISTTR
ncbi:MAG: hypothetical protein JWM91_883 [Rhodospirillales bacterium]|nr:hypothetical protein [Rhodospirillales bacterium]